MPARCSRGRRALAAELLDDVLASPSRVFRPQPEEGVTYARQDRARRPRSSISRDRRGSSSTVVRALSPHIGARARARTGATSRSGARASARTARSSRSRCSPTGGRRMEYDAWLRGLQVSPARRAAFQVLRRVFEDDAYADRAFRSAAAGLDERDRALAQRLAFGAVQRVRTLDHAIETLGRRRVHRLDPPVRAALRLGAYQLGVRRRRPALCRGERVGRARARRAGSLVRSRSRTRSCGGSPTGSASCSPRSRRRRARGRAQALVPGLGRGDVVARPRRRTARARSCAPRTSRPSSPCGSSAARSRARPTDVPGAWRVERIDEKALAEGRIWPQSRASQLVGLAVGAREGERTLDLCAAPGGKATMLAGEVVAVDVNEARARELEETGGGSARRTCAWSSRTAASCRPSSTASTARSWMRPARGSASSTGGPISAGAPSRCPSSSSSSCAPLPSASGREGRSSTRCARSTRTRRRRSSTPRGSRSTRRSREAWPQFRHRAAARVPADAPARPRHRGLLRRANACLGGYEPRIESRGWTRLSRTGPRARRARARNAHPNPVVGAVVVAAARSWGRAGTRLTGGHACEVTRLRRRREGPRRDGVRDAGALRAPGLTTPPCIDALHRGGRGACRRRAARPEPEGHGGGLGAARAGRGRGRARGWRARLPLLASRSRSGGRGSRKGGRSSPTRSPCHARRAGDACPMSAGSAERTRADSCTCCAPPRTPSRVGMGTVRWDNPRLDARGVPRRAASRAGSPSDEGRCRRAPSWSCAPGRCARSSRRSLPTASSRSCSRAARRSPPPSSSRISSTSCSSSSRRSSRARALGCSPGSRRRSSSPGSRRGRSATTSCSRATSTSPELPSLHMFTGIVRELGRVVSARRRRRLALVVEAPETAGAARRSATRSRSTASA